MDAGLCASCRHVLTIHTGRSTFWLCRRAQAEPERFPRYPRLPVLGCVGHEARED